MTGTSFSVVTRTTETGAVVTVTGEIDVATAPSLRTGLQDVALEPGHRLVVDLGGVTFCDSSGISALITAYNVAKAAGADVALAAVPARLSRTFGLIGLADFFPTYPSPEEALGG
ncbi:STAS domain-containing protein [Amycolatopsis sp. Hca4]|uniref:STAS domain-containing protein n=1 Tax=unclassified Amycolatopsis TaxID=2618356 RepID=UPI0015900179|nr:STAS domain-containing protein [Amycolatopsis sp. Hca4]QKV78826.1 STAS domain-containing protein [Amycolatopsis sp. Hca4]